VGETQVDGLAGPGGRPADMCENGVGISPAGSTSKAFRLNRSLRLPLDVKFSILVSRKSPAMEVAGAAAIFATLHDQRVLCMHQGAFNLG
jgi:hypothetical protein